METKQKSDLPTRVRTQHPTIATIATQMGLSPATVTHVLNGRAEALRIRPETQQRVLAVARDLGYRANASARAIRAGRFGNVALIQSMLGQYLPNELLHGLMKAVANKDLHLVLTQVPDVIIDDNVYLPHTMRELSADGLLINRHIGISQPLMQRIYKMRIPVILVNVQQEFDCIHPDDLMGGRIATEFLLRMGHEKIAYVDTADVDNPHYSKHDRRTGYEQAMASFGKIPHVHLLPQDWLAPGQPSTDKRVASAISLLSRRDRPTAVIAYELAEGMFMVQAALHLGLRIPEDLSIIQFHHFADAHYFLPFQTVSNAMVEVGMGAVDLLLEKIEAPEVMLPARIIPVKMLEGATCMPPART